MSAPFVILAAAVDDTHVDVTFDQAVLDGPVLRDRLTYSFDGGLYAEGVVRLSATVVRLTTSPQIGSRAYRVTVSAAVRNPAGEYLDGTHGTAPFVGAAPAGESVVSDLYARSHPDGGKIELYWTNPTPAPANTKIIRRLRSPVFDETDPGDVIYNGAALDPTNTLPLEPKYTDAAATLLELRLYYYVVMVGAASPYAIVEGSRTYGLVAAASFDTETWINEKGLLPRAPRGWDLRAPQDGELAKYVKLLGGWLRVQWSWDQALRYLNDMEEAPQQVLPAVIRSKGHEPEGERYDFDTLRRMALMLDGVHRVLGTGPGLVLAAFMLAHWDVLFMDLGAGARSRAFATWHRDSARVTGTTTVSPTPGTFTDGAATWATDEWAGDSRVIDGMGNWAYVASNTPTVVTLETPPTEGPWRSALTGGPYAAGVTSVTLSRVAGLLVGQRVQLWNVTTGLVDVVEITTVTAATGVVRFWNTTQNAHTAADSVMTWDITKLQAAMYGSTLGGAPAGELHVTAVGALHWQTNQWRGMVVRDSAGTEFDVVSNTETVMLLSPVAVVAAGAFRIAPVGGLAEPPAIYGIHRGEWHFLFEPLFDYELRGTRLDPYSYLFGGSFPLGGAWGPGDVGLYVWRNRDLTQPPTLHVSRVTAVAGPLISDDTANFTVNEFVGDWLLPNQAQTRLFRIASNTANTITVEGDISLVAVPAMAYVVFNPRNAERYSRLVARIQEFAPDDVRVRILFM